MERKESSENYLKRILLLSIHSRHVRAIDIAKAMNFSKPSVSVAIKNLKAKGHLLVSTDGYIELTPSGLHIAKNTLEKLDVISRVLIKIGVPKETALDDACKIEHDISDSTFKALKIFLTNEA